MAYDEHLAGRARSILARAAPAIRERQMFGGLALLVDGHMVCGVVGEELMLRLGEAAADAAVAQRHVRPMDSTGLPLRTMVYVGRRALGSDHELEAWLLRALARVRTLPPEPDARRTRIPEL